MVKYVPNNKSMAAFLVSDQLHRPVAAVTERIRQRARVIATGYRKTGDLAGSYKTGSAISAGPLDMPGMRWAGGKRRVGLVSTDDPAGAPNEFGNGRTPERRILRRAGRKYHVPIASERLVP